jgi:acetyl-CoA carboxylase biotin carboxylase subunit
MPRHRGIRMFGKVMIANRATVASRVIRTLRTLGIRSVAVYSEADRDLPYVGEADEAYSLGPAPARESYLNMQRLLGVAKASGADAVHPGYGFLSEDATFARACEHAGMRFIGPRADVIDALAHKQRARERMAVLGMPMAPASAVLHGDAQDALSAAVAVGFPLMLKPAGGGGGIGMQACADEAGLAAALAQSRRIAERAFGTAEVYAERLLVRPRHVEFQIVADRHGDAMHLFERDCSVQRRHQKVIEETAAPALDAAAVDALAVRAGECLRALGYDNIGTVETLHDRVLGFCFLEVNARLQVEHAVTEQVTGIDLVAAQIGLAGGKRLREVIPGPVARRGHAIQARVYAEDPIRFLPSPGVLARFRPPSLPNVRVECGYREGNLVTPHYDPMLAKVIAWAPDRGAAIARLVEALRAFEIGGVRSNLPFLIDVLQSESFLAGQVHTGLVSELQRKATSPFQGNAST